MDNRISLEKWSYEGDRAKLVYSDGDVVFVSKKDFDRAFGAIVSADKHDVIRDFALKE